MHTHKHAHTQRQKHPFTHTQTNTHPIYAGMVHRHSYVHTHKHTRPFTHTHTHSFTHKHTFMYTHTHTHTHTHAPEHLAVITHRALSFSALLTASQCNLTKSHLFKIETRTHFTCLDHRVILAAGFILPGGCSHASPGFTLRRGTRSLLRHVESPVNHFTRRKEKKGDK